MEREIPEQTQLNKILICDDHSKVMIRKIQILDRSEVSFC